MTSNVTAKHGEDEHKGGVAWTGEVIADETAGLVVLRQEVETKSTGNVGEHKDGKKHDTPVLAVATENVVEVDTQNNGEGNGSTVGNVE